MDWTDLVYGRKKQPEIPATIPSPLDTSQRGAISNARTQYPFMAGQVLVPTTKVGGEGWPAGEEGDPSYPRPRTIPLHQGGAEIGPNSTPGDVAGEALHSDPFANLTRDRLIKTLSPQQIEAMKHESLDAQEAPNREMMLRNGMDSAMRGSLVGQWPQSAIQKMQYTPEQLAIIQRLSNYMRTGRK